MTKSLLPPRGIRTLVTFVLACGLASAPRTLRADTVLEISSKKPFVQDQWKAYPKDAVKSTEGQFVMKAADSDTTAYAVTAATSATPMDLLNFTNHEVTFKLTDVGLKGSAAPGDQVFLLSLYDKVGGNGETPGSLRLRLDGAGDLGLTFTSSEGVHAAVWSTNVNLPLKSVTMTLGPKGVKIAYVDANGKKEETANWPGKLSEWEHVSPYLNLETHRNPGAGEVDLTLGSLNIDSKRAPGK